MNKSYYQSPIGILEIISKNNVLVSLKLVHKFSNTNNETDFINNIKQQLDEYFAGKRQVFDIKINPIGTEFQNKVWSELSKIPYGATASYSKIAENIGNIKAQRAVGSACNKNPIMIIIPCHRVITKNGNLGGFAYGNSIKHKILELESYNSKKSKSP